MSSAFYQIYSLESLVNYLVDNGLTDEEANHLLHRRFKKLEDKTLMQLINYGEWDMIRTFTEEYMLGEIIQ